jgi:phosphoribosylglycinamide formyltransferase-1
MTLPLAVLISGKGSNLGAIFAAIEAGQCDARVSAVLSDRESAEGLALARARGVATEVVRLKDYATRELWDAALGAAVAVHEPALVVLAGFMKVVGATFIARFRSRIINVHPSLLPSFAGTDGPAQAVRTGVRVSGCTVHIVDSGIDTGPIVAQAVVPVLPNDDADSLHQRIQRAEHRLLPAVIDAIARGMIELEPELRVAPRCFEAGAMLAVPSLFDTKK